jgi:hypothetical protein
MWIELHEKNIDRGPNYVLATPSFRNQQHSVPVGHK